MLEYPSLHCNSHWFRGFLHEVLDCARTPEGLQAVVLHPRQSLSSDRPPTVVIFFASGLSSVAVAAWQSSSPPAPARGGTLKHLLEEPAENFSEVTEPTAWRQALQELHLVLKARFDGRSQAPVLLTACNHGVALSFARERLAPVPQDPKPVQCAALASFLIECPPPAEEAPPLKPSPLVEIPRFGELPAEPAADCRQAPDRPTGRLVVPERQTHWTQHVRRALRAYPMSEGENAAPFVRIARRLIDQPRLLDSPLMKRPTTRERIEVLRYALKRDVLALVHYAAPASPPRVALFVPPQLGLNSTHNRLIEDARELLEVRGLAGSQPRPLPPDYRFVQECDALVVLADLINTLVLLASHQGCVHTLLPQAALAQRAGRATRAGFPRYDMGFDLPDPIYELSTHSRGARCVVTRELCVLDGERLFVQGALSLPVHGATLPYRLGLWTELHPTSAHILATWRRGMQSQPLVCLPGEVVNRVPLVPTTTGMPITVRLAHDACVPQLTLPPSDHLLSLEQRRGLTLARLFEYTAARHCL
jgi:hypothetical protein